jgi:hypothetical protein
LQVAAKPAPAPKKVVVDDTEPPKKPPARKKSAGGAKKSAPATAQDSPQKQGSAASPQAQPQPQ